MDADAGCAGGCSCCFGWVKLLFVLTVSGSWGGVCTRGGEGREVVVVVGVRGGARVGVEERGATWVLEEHRNEHTMGNM